MKKVIIGLLIFNGAIRVLDELGNLACGYAGIEDPESEIEGIDVGLPYKVEWGPIIILHKFYRALKEIF